MSKVSANLPGAPKGGPKPVPNGFTPERHQTSALRNAGLGKVAERVVHDIRAYIEANDLQPGQRLPPERYFIEQLKVSRSSLREAMRVLATLRLIEVRHGDGTYVTAPSVTGGASSAAIFDATEENALRNLVETRVGIEIAVVNAVVQRASEDDFDRLEQLLDRQAEQMARDPSSYAWEPLEFELALIEITGNTWLYEVEMMLRDAWRSLSGGLKASVSRYAEWHSEHRAILASLRSRNVAQAQRLVIAHVSFDRFEADLRAPRAHGARARAKGGLADT